MSTAKTTRPKRRTRNPEIAKAIGYAGSLRRLHRCLGRGFSRNTLARLIDEDALDVRYAHRIAEIWPDLDFEVLRQKPATRKRKTTRKRRVKKTSIA